MAGDDLLSPDDILLDLLKDREVVFDPESLRTVMAGIASAPQSPTDPDAWMPLIVSNPDSTLAECLRRYRDRVLADADGGLSAGKAATEPRLRALRVAMAERGLNAFIIPRADAHQGEYVPPHAQRLRWLTGFSGSAGTAVVTRERAAIFVDGRYTLQARDEVDTGIVEVIDSGQKGVGQWIAEVLNEGQKVGLDPWLHTPDGVAALRKSAGRAGVSVVRVEANPVDAVWADQPAPPLSPVALHLLDFAGEAASAKRRRVADALMREGASAAVLTLPDALAWLLNVRGGDIAHTPVPLSFGIVHADQRVEWFIDPLKVSPEVMATLEPDVRFDVMESFGPALDALGTAGQTVLVDPGTAPQWVFDRLEAAGGEVRRAADPVQSLKAHKNETELAGARRAHARDGAAMAQFLAWLDRNAAARADSGVPLTEMEAASVLASYRQVREHYVDSSFDTIAGAGEHGAIVHYRVSPESDRSLKRGELFLCDSGGQYRDGTTDITRTVVAGMPSEEMREAYTRVLKGHIALSTARFPKGTSGSQLDAFARRPLWEAGMDYAHGTGHGVGSFLGVHEGPQRISKMPSRVALAPGMICSNEPGYYKEGAYGIRIENLIAVTPAEDMPGGTAMMGFETLTLAPYCRALIDTRLLTEGERDWIDGYHARVRETVTPLVDAETAEWLANATAPLEAA